MNPASQVELDENQGAWAVSFAREIVENVVRSGTLPDQPSSIDDVFEIERGAFVTLRKNGQLRGCIGRPMPEQTAVEAIRNAAADAAASDPRFPAVEPRELDEITVEVSVLTPPEQLETVDPEAVTVGRDGLIVRQNGRSGLLLPQVPVEQGWDSHTFLEETCRKAGLHTDCWNQEDVMVLRFQAQVFAETEPKGPVKRVELDDSVSG